MSVVFELAYNEIAEFVSDIIGLVWKLCPAEYTSLLQ